MNVLTFAMVGVVFVPLGCSSGDKTDLPPGWDDAQGMVTFSQSACSGPASMPGAAPESITVTPGTGSVAVAYHNAHFRCDQPVQGFVTVGGGHLNYLVQPTDMNPSQVAGMRLPLRDHDELVCRGGAGDRQGLPEGRSPERQRVRGAGRYGVGHCAVSCRWAMPLRALAPAASSRSSSVA